MLLFRAEENDGDMTVLVCQQCFRAGSTYRSQSTANRSDISEVGRPSAESTRSIVIRAALGMDAAPTLASVAVKLKK